MNSTIPMVLTIFSLFSIYSLAMTTSVSAGPPPSSAPVATAPSNFPAPANPSTVTPRSVSLPPINPTTIENPMAPDSSLLGGNWSTPATTSGNQRSGSINFDDELIESMNHNPFESLTQVGSTNNRDQSHLYHKKSSYKR